MPTFGISWITVFSVPIGLGLLIYILIQVRRGQIRGKGKESSFGINEPEIDIKIDNCSWGNPTRIDYGLGRIIEVALTLYVKNPPVNVTDLQLYIEDGKQKLVDLSPPIPYTQENTKGCYLARFVFSFSNPNFVISNEVKKYQLCVMAMGRRWTSREFSPKDFSHSLTGDKEGSQS